MEPQQPTPKAQTKPGFWTIPRTVVAVLVVIIVVALVILVSTNGKSTKTNTGASQNISALQAAKVDITASGFVPATVQVKVGDTVTWTNTDSALHQVATDPYPAENGLAGFAAKTPEMKNDTYRYTFTTAGTFNYHDHLNPFKYKGTVIVK
jgi:plastocyanin